MKHKRNWIIGIVLSAAAGFVALQNVAAPSHDDITPPAITIADRHCLTNHRRPQCCTFTSRRD